MNTPLQLDLLKNRRQRGTHAPEATEFELHCAIADTLRISLKDNWDWWHTPNGEFRNDATGARLKRMGAKAGVFDIQLMSPSGIPYFLELKRKGGWLTETQKVFQARMEKKGVSCKVAWSYEEAILQLKEWGCVRVSL